MCGLDSLGATNLKSFDEIKKCIEIGVNSSDFTQLVSWLSVELKGLCGPEEQVHTLENQGDIGSFMLELNSLLKELDCPISNLMEGATSQRLATKEQRLHLLNFLITELQAAKMIAADSAIFAKIQTGEVMTAGSGAENKSERGEWGNQIEFLLACIGYAVGLGNVWRFPYLAYENGGGVFVIPYLISLLLAGIPIFFLELAIGQFSSLGPNCIYRNLVPVFQGVGWAMVVVSFVISVYYNVIIAWVTFYFFASFRKELEWGSCTNWWNTGFCQSNLEDQRCQEKLETEAEVMYFNKTCYIKTPDVEAMINASFLNASRLSPAEEYFNNYMYGLNEGEGEGFSNMGGFQWKLVLCLLFAWIVIFACLIKGVQSTGKVVYFTATFPYVVLIILLIRGCTLVGAGEGITFFITPNFTRLLEINVWRKAATQIFYSLGPAYGGLLTMASYNKFHNNCYRDALIVAFTNSGTSIFAGFAIFSTLGFMAHNLQKNVSDVVASGPSLAFIVYPEALVRMPLSPLWSILFFFMLFTLGLDTQFSMVETVTTAFMDQFPILRRTKWAVVGSACLVMFLLGLPMCLRGGIYIFTLFDTYSGGYCLIVIALMEFICIVYIYGLAKICKDIQLMLGAQTTTIGKYLGPTGYYFKAMWTVVAPIFMIAILIFSFIHSTRTKYRDYEFPDWAESVGWCLGTVSVFAIIVCAIYQIIKNRINNQPISKLFEATSEWCPQEEREKRQQQRASAVTMKTRSDQVSPTFTNHANEQKY